jgi:alpha-D-ribose 1-methylphosphonate 5-triphosphate synthase subunit PhnH
MTNVARYRRSNRSTCLVAQLESVVSGQNLDVYLTGPDAVTTALVAIIVRLPPSNLLTLLHNSPPFPLHSSLT